LEPWNEKQKKTCYVAVPNRKADTLSEMILKWIRPGSIIHSDCWSAYKCLTNLGYKHLAVNHSENFVDPETGAHTQGIERSWRDMRSNVPRYGRKEEHFDGYIAEHQFKQAVPDARDRLHIFLEYANKVIPELNV
jgi:transposase-like protein